MDRPYTLFANPLLEAVTSDEGCRCDPGGWPDAEAMEDILRDVLSDVDSLPDPRHDEFDSEVRDRISQAITPAPLDYESECYCNAKPGVFVGDILDEGDRRRQAWEVVGRAFAVDTVEAYNVAVEVLVATVQLVRRRLREDEPGHPLGLETPESLLAEVEQLREFLEEVKRAREIACQRELEGLPYWA